MKNKISELNKALKALHRRFLENERVAAEKALETRLTPWSFLNLLTTDQNFLWIKPFSSLILDIDELDSEKTEITADDLSSAHERVMRTLYEPNSKIFEQIQYYIDHDGEFVLLNSRLNEILITLIKK
jgi:hypothetical protein